ncbi:MAG: aminoglycoside phosphotransferase family protein [Pseudomonadota bacterium]
MWRVETETGSAVLKVFSERGIKVGDPIGTQLLKLWDGKGAVRLLGERSDAVLMEWLEGPSLADITRPGQDEEAAQVIANTALTLQAPPVKGYIPLKDHFGGVLLSSEIETYPQAVQPVFARAQAFFEQLLRTTDTPKLLHGDLNYDNVIKSHRGWLAIDPKGIIADPCYDFGVVFRNPIDEADRIATPRRIEALGKVLASHTGLNCERILQFGFAHVAMSLAYHFRRASTLSETDLAILRSFYAVLTSQSR